jgi:hypothetical protein
MQEQEQQQKQPVTPGRFQMALQICKILLKALKQDAIALQAEDRFVQSFEQLNVPEQSIQIFKERLKKARQAAAHTYSEDTYIMGGILLFCGILFPILINVGIPDFFSRFAWIAFAVSFPAAVGFFLARYLKKRNDISSYGGIHSYLAFLSEIGILATTAGLFFHIWNVAGWLFLFWALAIFFGYLGYRFGIYFKPLLDIFKENLKNITPPPEKEHDLTRIPENELDHKFT